MITKKIKYTNPFNGASETVEAYFHLNKSDTVALQAKANDAGFTDVEAQFNAVVTAGNNVGIYNIFKELLLTAYGKRQGSRFVKSQAIREDFEGSEEFSELIWYLMENEDELGEFFAKLLTPSVERAPMLKDTQAPTQNVFDDQAPQNVGEVTHEMPPVAERGPVPNEVEGPTPSQIPGVKNDNRPRLLQGVELEKMSFAEVQKGLAAGRFRLE